MKTVYALLIAAALLGGSTPAPVAIAPAAAVAVQPAASCWAGPPLRYSAGQARCWRGVPFRLP